MSEKPDYILDATGLFCPEPVMLLHNQIREDIPRFCNFLGHELLEHNECDGNFRYLLRKQGDS
jgi:tRNA 2-thiouridine synthesizing protein A